MYTGDDVAVLRLLAKLVASGRTIGDVAKRSRRELEALAGSSLPASPAAEERSGRERLVDNVLEAARRFDTMELDRKLTDALLALGSAEFVRRVAVPLLDEVGGRWSEGRLSVADEHLTSGLLRSLLVGMLRTRRRSARPMVLLTTPSGERHELGILLVALLCAEAGLGLCYLGPDLPADEVLDAAARAEVEVVGLSLVNAENRTAAAAEIRRIEKTLPLGTELWLGGRDARGTVRSLPGSRALVIDDLDSLDAEVTRLRQTAPRPS